MTSTTRAIADKIAAKLGAKSKIDSEIAELERQQRWAEGEDRRTKLATYAEEARKLSEQAADTSADLTSAAQAVTDSIRRLTTLADAHNIKIDELRQQITAEGVRNSFTPPSPSDGGVGVNGNAIIIGEYHLVPVDRAEAVALAIRAADKPDGAPTLRPTVVHRPLPVGGRFWQHPEFGSTLMADQQPHECVELSKIEYLAHQWGIERLTDLPEHVLAQLEDTDRARVATRILDELDGTDRAQFAQSLLPPKETQ